MATREIKRPSIKVEVKDDNYKPYIIDNGKKRYLSGDSEESMGFMIDTTYAELKALRDEAKLIPGMKYRITDYECCVNDTYHKLKTAGHPFDIIVVADDVNKINENATACRNDSIVSEIISYFHAKTVNEPSWEGDFMRYPLLDNEEYGKAWVNINFEENQIDTSWYFYTQSEEVTQDSTVVDNENYSYRVIQGSTKTEWKHVKDWDYFINSDLSAWKLKYKLDYPTTDSGGIINIFDWCLTDNYEYPENFKGIIYQMADEFNNQCPYDFKNIQILNAQDNEWYYTFECTDGDGSVNFYTEAYAMNNFIDSSIEWEEWGRVVAFPYIILNGSYIDCNTIGKDCKNIYISATRGIGYNTFLSKAEMYCTTTGEITANVIYPGSYNLSLDDASLSYVIICDDGTSNTQIGHLQIIPIE